jgi:hypothetical protein
MADEKTATEFKTAQFWSSLNVGLSRLKIRKSNKKNAKTYF